MRHLVDFLNELDERESQVRRELGREKLSENPDSEKIFWLKKRFDILRKIREFPVKHRN